MASENKPVFVARDALVANYIAVPGRPGEKLVGVLMQDREGTDALWAMEENAVTKLIALLSGGLREESVQILEELSRTDIITSWSRDEDEDTGLSTVRLELYGQVSCEIPEHEADSAIQMLSSVLHAQGHKQLGD